MNQTRPASAGTVDIVADATICAGLAVVVVAATAVAVALLGLGDDARRALRFGFGGVQRTPAEAVRIATHNASFAAGTLAFAIVTPRLPARARLPVGLLLATLLFFNSGAVGVALGAYGHRVAVATALHLPLEFAALSLAGGAYMSTSRRALSPGALARVAALCALLLAAAATLETYASLGGLR